MRLRIPAERTDPQTAPPRGFCPLCGGELYRPPAPGELCPFCEAREKASAMLHYNLYYNL